MEAAAIDRRAYPEGMRLWTWAAPDGWLHRRLDWPQPEPRPARGSLLFVGGRGDFVEKYVEALGEWHRRGWAVASFDWRGQGRSKGTIVGGHFESFDILVQDLSALIEDWMAAAPPPHVVVAHSMGAHMLLRLLIERPPPLQAAVLVAPMIAVNSGPIPVWLARLIAGAAVTTGFSRRPLWGAPLARAPVGSKRQRVLTSCPDRYEDEAYWWQQQPDYGSSAPTFGWLRAAYRSAAAFSEHALQQLRLPVLLIATERDALVSPAAIRRVAGLLPHAQLALFNDSAHEILRERDAIRLLAMARIDAFLDEHAP